MNKSIIFPFFLLFAFNTDAKIYDGSDISGIEKLVETHLDSTKWRGKEAWRTNAEQRIELLRKRRVTVLVNDTDGNAVSGAIVGAKLIQHEFEFGTVFDVRQFNRVRDVIRNFGNQIGFSNALKYKWKDKLGGLAAEPMEWANNNGVTVRGHTLIWPGWKHMHADALPYRKVDDKEGLKRFVDNQIIEAASKWDVMAWDVINEPLDNQDLQPVLGPDAMAHWFRLAAANRRNPNATLYINENRIISAPARQRDRIPRFIDTIDSILSAGGPIEGIGVQARFRTDDIKPEEVYARLDRLGVFGLPIVATEFEIVDTRPKFAPSDFRRAEMTENYMTILFSHPRVNGIVAWTLLNKLSKRSRSGDKAQNIPDNRGLLNWDSSVPLNGKIWLHLINKRWHTDVKTTTDVQGVSEIFGFKGFYIISITNGSKTEQRLIKIDDQKDKHILVI
jgi:GH35 family endo-1,4-beta-xylanase